MVCEALKANPKTADIPVLMFSVFDIRKRALAAGASAFLQKPAAGAGLIAVVEELLAAQRHTAA
jgi:CheY-like chemotaxis protein